MTGPEAARSRHDNSDTNVAAVANGDTPQAETECVLACIRRLQRIRHDEKLLLDDRGHILDEYPRRLTPVGEPRPGHAFFKWLWNN